MNSEISESEDKSSKGVRPESSKTSVNKSVPKNLTALSARRLSEIKREINDKPFGRSIKESEIIEFAINEIKAKHIAILREQTLSGTDRLRLRYQEFKIENSDISFDEFVDGLLATKLKMPKSDAKVGD